MTKNRALAALMGLLLVAAIVWAGVGRGRGVSPTGPPPEVIGPGVLLQSTADSYDRVSVAFSPDGRTVAVGRLDVPDRGVSLLDTILLRETSTIKAAGESGEACAVAFSPDGRTLAIGRYQGVALHDPVTGQERLALKAEYDYGPLGLAYSADGRRLAAAAFGHVIIWDLGTGRWLGSFKAHTRSIQGVSLSPDGSLVASASDGPIVCHSYGPMGLPSRIFGVASVGCGPDYGIVRVFDVTTGRETASLQHRGTARSVSFSPDGRTLATASYGGACLWDIAAGHAQTIVEGRPDAELDVECVAFSPDGRTVSVGVGRTVDDHHPGEVWLWDINSSRVRTILTAEMGAVRSIAFAPDGKSLVAASSRSVVLWDLPPASPTTSGSGPKPPDRRETSPESRLKGED